MPVTMTASVSWPPKYSPKHTPHIARPSQVCGKVTFGKIAVADLRRFAQYSGNQGGNDP